ncbi:MAG TPA: serpin family protein [Gemmatimonadales bacterium]|nr:serpin family protein [Gemmatimonadales bacterium]
MSPRRFVPLLSLLAACSIFTTESKGPPPLLTELPRSLSAPEALLIGAGNQFGFDLLREARAEAGAPDSNLFLSPVSAAMALGMTLNGAAGTTLDSMRLALRLESAPLADVNAGFSSLIALLKGLDGTSEFQIANSIWADAGFPFLPTFLTAGRANFDAEVRTLDLQAPATLGIVNDWVKDKTNDKIPTILDEIRADEVMFLINALYFKGKWRVAFDPKDTRPAPFHAADGSTQNVPTMLLAPTTQRYAETAEYRAVELLYGNGAFGMTIVLPAPGRTLADLLNGLDTTRWAEWTGALHEQKIGLTLPKFRIEYKRELKEDLSKLGMGVAFDENRADFSNMADLSQAGARLFLTRVTQKTFVDVNEEGTEAAAATSVGVGVTSAPLTLSVDRPFLFAIRERLSGTIFFLGQVNRIGN